MGRKSSRYSAWGGVKFLEGENGIFQSLISHHGLTETKWGVRREKRGNQEESYLGSS